MEAWRRFLTIEFVAGGVGGGEYATLSVLVIGGAGDRGLGGWDR